MRGDMNRKKGVNRKGPSKPRRWVEQTVDDDVAEPAPPEPDFIDVRPGVTHGATAWGDAPRGDLEAVEDVLDTVLGRFAGTPRSALQDIVAVWDAVTGAAWTGTTPAGLADGTLIVEVPDGMTATRLQFEGPQVVRALRNVAGGRVRKVRFRVARR